MLMTNFCFSRMCAGAIIITMELSGGSYVCQVDTKAKRAGIRDALVVEHYK